MFRLVCPILRKLILSTQKLVLPDTIEQKRYVHSLLDTTQSAADCVFVAALVVELHLIWVQNQVCVSTCMYKRTYT